jgi:hypothetical protein
VSSGRSSLTALTDTWPRLEGEQIADFTEGAPVVLMARAQDRRGRREQLSTNSNFGSVAHLMWSRMFFIF